MHLVHKTYDPDLFDIGELEMAIDSMVHDKASCHDGFSLVIIREIFHCHPQWLPSLYNQCLKESKFPQSWKLAVGVYFPKKGKRQEQLCFLPSYLSASRDWESAGQNVRIPTGKLPGDPWRARQQAIYFLRNHSTVDALHEGVRYISEGRLVHLSDKPGYQERFQQCP